MRLPALVALLAAIVCPALARAAVQAREVTHAADGVTYKSVFVYDDAQAGRRPAVLVFPEWWGRTDYPVSRAKQLAALGYAALAVDVYGDARTTNDPKQAGELAGAASQGGALRQRTVRALEQLRAQPEVDPARVAAVGYCFGGGAALELARSGADVRGVVALHAPLDADAPADQVKARLLILSGGADPMVPLEKVKAFIDRLDQAKVAHEVTVYSGAKHAFSNPAADAHNLPGVGYQQAADERSFEAMRTFLAAVLK